MGFDVSFQPVDVELIQGRLLPFVEGRGDIDDLVEDAVRITKVRFRANAWALELLRHSQAENESKPRKKGAQHPPSWRDKFDSDLHVWGRPFFITALRPDQVSRAVDRYLKAQPEDVDAIAHEMLRILDPGLVDKVVLDADSPLLGDDQLAAGIREPMDLFRECFKARSNKKKVRIPDGNRVEPAELFKNSFALRALSFAALFRPGWIARGRVWPTALLEEAGLEVPPFFETSAPLFQPLLSKVPEIAENMENTISANRMVGGYVSPDNVSDLRIYLEEHLDKFRSAECRVAFQKILEAVQYAEREHMGFAEASEICSGPWASSKEKREYRSEERE
jgi:hypothetical protein